MAAKATWDDLVSLVKSLRNIQSGTRVTGELSLADQSSINAVRACLAAEDDTHLKITSDHDASTITVGTTISVEISPRIGFGLLLDDVAALLNARYALVKEPPRYFLLADSLSATDTAADEHVLTRYRAVLEFIQALKRAAAFLDQDDPSLVFIKDGKFDLPISYTVDDLMKVSVPDLRAISAILPEGTHQKQCEGIMADAVISLTQHQPSQARFQYLLEHTKELRKRYEDGYKLFASGFSYEKVRDQIEAARVEYTGKIHKVLSDVQNQLLGIPVATIIVATQMKDATAIGYAFWVNSAVLLGCWVFAVLMLFLIHNQSHTLGVIETEVDRQKRQMKNEFASIESIFKDAFLYLAKRLSTQRRILWTIDIFVVAGLLLSHVIYFKLTKPALDWLVTTIPYLAKIIG